MVLNSESELSRVKNPRVKPAAPASSAPAARYVQVTNVNGSSWGRKPRYGSTTNLAKPWDTGEGRRREVVVLDSGKEVGQKTPSEES